MLSLPTRDNVVQCLFLTDGTAKKGNGRGTRAGELHNVVAISLLTSRRSLCRVVTIALLLRIVICVHTQHLSLSTEVVTLIGLRTRIRHRVQRVTTWTRVAQGTKDDMDRHLEALWNDKYLTIKTDEIVEYTYRQRAPRIDSREPSPLVPIAW